jgi:hypothetical protein
VLVACAVQVAADDMPVPGDEGEAGAGGERRSRRGPSSSVEGSGGGGGDGVEEPEGEQRTVGRGGN